MIKCEVIKNFSFNDFSKVKNLVRRINDKDGNLNVGDTFECDKNTANYLLGKNDKNKIVVKVLEIIPEKVTTRKKTNKK